MASHRHADCTKRRRLQAELHAEPWPHRSRRKPGLACSCGGCARARHCVEQPGPRWPPWPPGPGARAAQNPAHESPSSAPRGAAAGGAARASRGGMRPIPPGRARAPCAQLCPVPRSPPLGGLRAARARALQQPRAAGPQERGGERAGREAACACAAARARPGPRRQPPCTRADIKQRQLQHARGATTNFGCRRSGSVAHSRHHA